MTSQKWEPTNYQKDKLIYSTRKYIKQKLDNLYKELGCNNEFIFKY